MLEFLARGVVRSTAAGEDVCVVVNENLAPTVSNHRL